MRNLAQLLADRLILANARVNLLTSNQETHAKLADFNQT
jgi:hypothetical protein